MIAVVDYGAGNIHSVLNCLRLLGADGILTRKASTLRICDGILLPGVGAFGYAARALEELGLTRPLREAAQSGKPLLGVCLGMQLLTDGSEESPGVSGLGLIPGRVTALHADGRKIPHTGWTSLDDSGGRLMDGTDENEFFYFVHSYACHARDRSDCAATATYGERFDAVFERNNVFGTQFHPEKSSAAGRRVLRRFLQLCGEEDLTPETLPADSGREAREKK